jgi:uncharacterized damage-inducible protein DinB
MNGSLMEAAFAHHTWATTRIVDVCLGLDDEQLQTNVPGTRGPIIETLCHVIYGDGADLFFLTQDRSFDVVLDDTSLGELRDAAERFGAAWQSYLAEPVDPHQMVKEVDESDGFERLAPVGLRLAGALQHGADHRSQISTALTTLGIQPPSIDVWAFGLAAGRTVESMPGG